MSQFTGENESSLHAIINMIRISSIILLLLHFYYYDYPAFQEWGLTADLGDILMANLGRVGLFDEFLISKMAALLLLGLSLLGAHGKKDPDHTPEKGTVITAAGIVLYFASGAIFWLDFPEQHLAILYIALCSSGYLLMLRGGSYFSRIIWQKAQPDIFNRLHESFPQEERRLEADHRINLPARYLYQGETRDSWINIEMFRGTLILGSPGSGKTWYVVQNIIRQVIAKGYSMLLYDFKYDDLAKIAYNYFRRYESVYPGKPGFYNISMDDLSRSHRCNCLAPYTMTDITDAGEASRTLLLGLNPQWVPKQGEFFSESAINFVKALIWFLRLYEDGRYCSWPHVIELAQTPYKKLFTVLSAEPQVLAHISMFKNAFLHGAAEQLEGQIASATISLAKLSSPSIYYILTGDDFTLDLNNPESPKILTIGGNPQKTGTYGPVIAAYINAINRLANRKNMHPFAEVLDEFSTIIVHTIDKSIATGRSNKMAITLCLQDASQLRLAYGDKFAEVILQTCGNIIAGQVSGETAKLLSERFGKTMQAQESMTFTSSDTTITHSGHLEYSVPISRISSLSSGEFVGMVADRPDDPIELKTFCCRIVNDPTALAEEEKGYKELPVVQKVTQEMLLENFQRVRNDILALVNSEMQRIENNRELQHLVIR
jgi:YWFCY protein/TraM recognition site of TraD and TraG